MTQLIVNIIVAILGILIGICISAKFVAKYIFNLYMAGTMNCAEDPVDHQFYINAAFDIHPSKLGKFAMFRVNRVDTSMVADAEKTKNVMGSNPT